MQDGSAHNLFMREKKKAPALGDCVNPTTSEKTGLLCMPKILPVIVLSSFWQR